MEKGDSDVYAALHKKGKLVTEDIEEARQIVRGVLNEYNDSLIFQWANKTRINVDCRPVELRDRMERYHVRLYYGAPSGVWDPSIDEEQDENDYLPTASPQTSNARRDMDLLSFEDDLQPNTENPRNRMSSPVNLRLPSMYPVLRPNLPTGQTFGAFQDPITFSEPSHQRRDERDSEIVASRTRVGFLSPPRTLDESQARIPQPQAQSTRCPSSRERWPGLDSDAGNGSAMELTAPLQATLSSTVYRTVENPWRKQGSRTEIRTTQSCPVESNQQRQPSVTSQTTHTESDARSKDKDMQAGTHLPPRPSAPHRVPNSEIGRGENTNNKPTPQNSAEQRQLGEQREYGRSQRIGGTSEHEVFSQQARSRLGAFNSYQSNQQSRNIENAFVPQVHPFMPQNYSAYPPMYQPYQHLYPYPYSLP